MKKFFTLIAMTLMAVGVNAQGSYRPEAGNVDGDVRLTPRGDALMTAKTVFAATTANLEVEGTPAPETFADKTFNTYIQVRVNVAPTTDTPTGTQQDGSSPITFEALKDVDLTIYYRRQAESGTTSDYTENGGKDMKLIDQSNPSSAIVSADYKSFDIDGSYANVCRVFKLTAGKTYTLWARGTTGRLYGFDWAEASSVTPGGEGSSIADGTYFISYSEAPTESNVTTSEMTNTGSSNNCATWSNGFSLMIMRSDKGLSSGSNINIDGTDYKSIKLSNGAQNKLTLPEGKIASGITIYSYQNTDAITTRDAYWKEVAGIDYDAETSGGLFASFKDGTNPDKREYSFNGSKLNVITFTNTGEQQCFVLKVDIATGEVVTGINTISATTIDLNAPVYNIAGQKVANDYKGLVIKNGRKFIQK